ncbi:MAG: HD domain-containing protein [Candidatus Lokiarchaeota archaeon]|nr:HD domain-containing protein [Candidatus Lokiarchaeota archaeon]
MSEILKVNEILQRIKENSKDFSFRTKLQVIKQTKKYTSDRRPYFSLTFRDQTGDLPNFNKWTNNEEEYKREKKTFEIGNIIEFTGRYKAKFGSIDISEPENLNKSEFNLDDFSKPTSIDITSLVKILEGTILNLQNTDLKTILEVIFSEKDIKNKYIECPSSVIHHHNYKHGNLEHTVGMINIFDQMVSYYKRNTLLDVDLIYTGIILHDIGKIFEFELNNDLPMKTVEGKLYGHLILGDQYVSKVIEGIENISKDLENKIRHLILSHHGKIEWDSVVEPQFDEAEILHLLDMIDSRFKLNY